MIMFIMIIKVTIINVMIIKITINSPAASSNSSSTTWTARWRRMQAGLASKT